MRIIHTLGVLGHHCYVARCSTLQRGCAVLGLKRLVTNSESERVGTYLEAEASASWSEEWFFVEMEKVFGKGQAGAIWSKDHCSDLDVTVACTQGSSNGDMN